MKVNVFSKDIKFQNFDKMPIEPKAEPPHFCGSVIIIPKMPNIIVNINDILFCFFFKICR